MASAAPPPLDWKDFWDIAAHVGTLAGLLVTAVWAYFNFIKSRTYYPRMELTACGELRTKDDCQFLIPRIELRNIGKSKVKLNQSGSGYRVWLADGSFAPDGTLAWSGGKPVFPVFERHKWIEPGEYIFDELDLFALPATCVAAKIEARLTAPIGWPRRKNTVWSCSTIVGPATEKVKTHDRLL